MILTLTFVPDACPSHVQLLRVDALLNALSQLPPTTQRKAVPAYVQNLVGMLVGWLVAQHMVTVACISKGFGIQAQRQV